MNNKLFSMVIGIIILLFVSLTAFALFDSQPHQSEVTHQIGDFQVEKLFTQDGCTAYRFQDYGDPVYYVKCGNQVQTDYEHLEGKVEQHFQVKTENLGQQQ